MLLTYDPEDDAGLRGGGQELEKGGLLQYDWVGASRPPLQTPFCNSWPGHWKEDGV